MHEDPSRLDSRLHLSTKQSDVRKLANPLNLWSYQILSSTINVSKGGRQSLKRAVLEEI